MKILWETDKVNFTSSNLVCVYTHPKFQNMKFSLSVFDKIIKNPIQMFSCHNRKWELLIDGLILSGSLQTFDVRKCQNKFCKLSQNCNLSALLNFTSLYIMQSSLPTTIYVQNLSFLVSQISTSYNFFFYLVDLPWYL